MPTKLKPVSVIKTRLGIEKGGPVHQYFTQRCRVHMDKFIPEYNGDLRRNYTEGVDYIKYNSPYAHYIYEGIKYVMPHNNKSAYFSEDYGFWSDKNGTKIPTNEPLVYHTAGTGPHWDERMWSAEKNEVIEEVQNYIRRK